MTYSGLKGRQFDITGALLKRATECASALAALSGRFPLSTADGRPDIDLRKATYEVMVLRSLLVDAAESLQSTPLEAPISNALRLTALSAPRLLALARAITLEDRASRRENREWTWSGAMAAFNSRVYPTIAARAQCDWESLIDGGYLHELDDETHALIELAITFVMEPPRPEDVGYIVRRGSAHEEHVRGNRSWCALCGWLDLITRPTETQRLYHFGAAHAAAGGPHN